MSPKKGVLTRIALFAGMLALGSFAVMPQAARAQTDVFAVNHFDVTFGDGTVRTINPTTTSAGILCEMIYVFDAHEEMQECCGCPVTNDGLRTMSTVKDLTANPLSGPGTSPKTGVIKIVSAPPNAAGGAFAPCNPALSLAPTPTLVSFSTHVYANATIGAGITETEFEDSPLSASELSTLTSVCSFIHTNGTGHGICTCGVGDNIAAVPGSGGR